MNLQVLIHSILRRNGKFHFLSKLRKEARILDVGCGNNSPYKFKRILPFCHYTGLDVADYNIDKPEIADEYIITTPNDFVKEIDKFDQHFDAVVSSHNLEHCLDRDGVLLSMLKSVKKGGEIFLSFPTEKSVNFPRRKGTLNYYDDPTHMFAPPNFDEVIKVLKENDFIVSYSQKQYSPLILKFFGFLFEPISRMKNKVMRGTWEYYGFESIITAKKKL